VRIAFVEHKLNLRTGGGSNITLHHMASALAGLGHDVTLITVTPAMNGFPADLPYRVLAEPLSDTFLNFRGKLALANLLRRRERQFDIYQLEAPSLLLAGGLYRRLGGRVPVVARLHNYSFFCTNTARMDAECHQHCTLLDQLRHRPESGARQILLAPLRVGEHWAGRLLVNRVDRFIALSPGVAEIHARQGLDAAKMALITPPIDYAALRRRARQRAVPPEDRAGLFTILFAGRLNQAKGVDTLLRAAARLDFPFRLEIVGEGDAREGLERLVGELGLAGRVEFRGWVPQAAIIDRYLDAHLFVHPGRWPEPAGRTVMEAMALGVPLVVSAVGGPPGLAGEAALTFRPDDSADLAAQITVLYRDPARAAALAVAGPRRAQRFDRQQILDQLLGVYDELRAMPLGQPAGEV
jgi:glycosyltransferase involved in cell wall biosynthesis